MGMDDSSILAHRRILRACGAVIAEFKLISAGDRIAVGLSGGKDSCTLLETLVRARQKSPIPFDLIAFTIDQGKFRGDIQKLDPFVKGLGVEWHLVEDRSSLRLLETSPDHGCDLCSRFRRTAVYSVASKLGCNVVALGHTADDFAESLLRNIIFSGQVRPLPVRARSTHGEFLLIRPFARVWEKWIIQRAAELGVAAIPCVCNEKDGPRARVRRLISELQEQNKGVAENILAAAVGQSRVGEEALLPVLNEQLLDLLAL